MSFSDTILEWYRKHKRDLPWRKSDEPYNVWLSEIMLQQTRVEQGLPYYLKFISKYPTICDLAAAEEEEVLKLWQGLGYYSRARNLHRTAKMVCYELGGKFPETYEGLHKLKGVGPYTASAIGSICFSLATPVVDGNVFRLLSRYFGVELPIDSGEGIRYFLELAKEVMPSNHFGEYNQGVMEFGSKQCVPKSPDCAVCPLAESCWALSHQKIATLPFKRGKQKIRNRYFHYMVPLDSSNNTYMHKRSNGGIWSQLYEFPLLESESAPTLELVQQEMVRILGLPHEESLRISQFNDVPVVHKLSHQHLHTTFWLVKMQQIPNASISWRQAKQLPVPVLIANFIETLENSYF
ncbi:MAG: A/G-specific adenine glycosylase [Bacteroidota bacterium]|jgi:A/G-specific adenine glycosylase